MFRKEKELDSKVRKPAEAEKYRLERIAEADKQKIVLEAEAEAEAKALKVNVRILGGCNHKPVKGLLSLDFETGFTHKGRYFRDDCTDFFLHVSLFSRFPVNLFLSFSNPVISHLKSILKG